MRRPAAARRPASVYPQAWQGNPNDPRLRHYQQLERRNQAQGYAAGDRRDRGDRDWRDDRGDGDDPPRRPPARRLEPRLAQRPPLRLERWRYSNRNVFRLSPYYSPYRNYR